MSSFKDIYEESSQSTHFHTDYCAEVYSHSNLPPVCQSFVNFLQSCLLKITKYNAKIRADLFFFNVWTRHEVHRAQAHTVHTRRGRGENRQCFATALGGWDWGLQVVICPEIFLSHECAWRSLLQRSVWNSTFLSQLPNGSLAFKSVVEDSETTRR